MASYHGKDLSISWVYSGGTVALNTDYRSVDYTPSVELYDQTAGADTNKTYISGTKDGVANFMGLDQAGGTALITALSEGNGGTLIVAPEGTAVGKQKITLPAISQGVKRTWPYNNLCEISCAFQQNGARVDGTY